MLISIDGVWANVMKIKPPMLFSEQDADELLAAAGHSLRALQHALPGLELDTRFALLAEARRAADAYFDRVLAVA